MEWFLPSANAEVGNAETSSAKSAETADSPSNIFHTPNAQECNAMDIDPANKKPNPPYGVAPFSARNIGEQCGNGVKQGLNNFLGVGLAQKGEKEAARVCDPAYDQAMKALNKKDPGYNIKAHAVQNRWDECTLAHGLGGMAGAVVDGGVKALQAAGEFAQAIENPLIGIAKLSQVEYGLAQWFMKKKSPEEALLFFCEETKGLSCMYPAAQTRAICACITGTTATFASFFAGGAATKLGMDAAKEMRLAKALSEGRMAASGVIKGSRLSVKALSELSKKSARIAELASKGMKESDEFRKLAGEIGALKPADRKALAAHIMAIDPKSKGLDELIEIHNICPEHSIGSYPASCLALKMQKCSGLFDESHCRELIRGGVLGNPPPPDATTVARHVDQAQQFEKTLGEIQAAERAAAEASQSASAASRSAAAAARGTTRVEERFAEVTEKTARAAETLRTQEVAQEAAGNISAASETRKQADHFEQVAVQTAGHATTEAAQRTGEALGRTIAADPDLAGRVAGRVAELDSTPQRQAIAQGVVAQIKESGTEVDKWDLKELENMASTSPPPKK